MKLNTYLNFDGQCEAAFAFYQRHLGGEFETMLRWREFPGGTDVPESHRDKIMHACLIADGHMLMGCDIPPDRPFDGIRGAIVAIQVNTPQDAERLFDGLSQGGKVTMPLGETFWANSFGMLVDKFGVPWMVNCGKETAAFA